MTTLNRFARRLAAALLVALVALALPHAANAQPILRGKAQQAAAAATATWQPVSAAFAAPGQGALPARWEGLAAGRLNPPVIVVELAPAPVSAPSVTEILPLPAPWLMLP